MDMEVVKEMGWKLKYEFKLVCSEDPQQQVQSVWYGKPFFYIQVNDRSHVLVLFVVKTVDKSWEDLSFPNCTRSPELIIQRDKIFR